MAEEKRIMCVGMLCVDIVCVCDGYPLEDSDQRSADQIWQRGGNASNNCTVLSLLGAPHELLATIAVAPELSFVKQHLSSYGINTDHCVYHENCKSPLSVIILNTRNGSRTIMHSNKNLPEITLEDFKKINLAEQKYKWIHFEGRPGVNRVKEMLECVDKYNKTVTNLEDKITTSVELEKTRQELGSLCDQADYVFLSKEHSQSCGYSSKEEAVQGYGKRCREGATVICAWGEDGAIGQTWDGHVYTSPIFPPDRVVDTLGAGDTFLASTILTLSRGAGLEEAITFGCKAAGAKCGMQGYDGLRTWMQTYQKHQQDTTT